MPGSHSLTAIPRPSTPDSNAFLSRPTPNAPGIGPGATGPAEAPDFHPTSAQFLDLRWSGQSHLPEPLKVVSECDETPTKSFQAWLFHAPGRLDAVRGN
jgi:hypothetical protein